MGKLSVNDAYGQLADHTVQTTARNEQVLQENLSSETIAKLQSAKKQLFGNLTDTQWNGLLADSILGKSAKLESMLKTELRTAETMLQEAEAVGDAALQQQAQTQINSIRAVQAQILEAKGRRAQTQAGAGGVGSATPEGGLTDAPNNGTIGDKEGAPAEGKENAAYNAYLRMLDELEAARISGMTARDFAISKGVPSTLTDEEAVFLDSKNIRLQTEGAGNVIGNLDGLTQAERTMVADLVKQGKNVEIIPRSNVPRAKTPDFKVNGVKTELKTLNGTSLNTPVTRITEGFGQGAEVVIIDARATGLTAEQANEVLNRIIGIYKGRIPGKIEIWTNYGIIYGGTSHGKNDM